MKGSVYTVLFGISLALIPLISSAAPVIRTGDTISLKEDQAIAGDFYTFGRSVTNSARVGGDAYIIAGTVTQNGEVNADISAVTGQFEIHAPVGDDVRVVGGRIMIANKVVGDVVVVGGELTIASTAEIEGDVIFYGGSLTVEGPVMGSILATAETVRIDSRIGKDIDVTAHAELTFGSHADVGGNVRYKSGKEAVRAIDSIIVGSIVRDEHTTVTDQGLKSKLMPVLMMLFTGLVARFVLGNRITEYFSNLNTFFGRATLIGFAGLVLTPIASALAFASVLGIIIGTTLLFAYATLLLISWGLSGLFLGGLLSKYITGTATYGPLSIVGGTIVMYATTFIPGFGHIIALVVTLMVMGGFLLSLYERYR